MLMFTQITESSTFHVIKCISICFFAYSLIGKCEELGPSICPNGYCIALSNGDYECQCELGYQSTSDHKKCIMQMEERE